MPEEQVLYAPKSKLDPLVIAAYNEFNTRETRQYQRDYIYYGIDNENKPGYLKTNIYEELFAFKIDASAFKTISDQPGDPTLNEDRVGPPKGKPQWGTDDVLKAIGWKDGAFEIIFKIFISIDGGKTMIESVYPATLNAKDLFSLKKYTVWHENGTIFNKHEYDYYVSTDDLTPRWVVPNSGSSPKIVDLPKWNLLNGSMIMHMLVYEKDQIEEKTYTYTVRNEFADKADFSFTGSAGKPDSAHGEIKLGYGFTSTTLSESTVTTKVTLGSDELGTIEYGYNRPVILNVVNKGSSDEKYELNVVSNNTVTVALVPRMN